MLNIRTRIFLLALVALTSVSSAFYIEYRNIQRQIAISDNTLKVLNWVQSLSDIIHPIQKERGLTASHMVSQENKLLALLTKQQQVTESLWKEVEHHELFRNHAFTQSFPERLKAIRQSIQLKQVNWPEVRDFYTLIVQRFMELMVLNVASINDSQEQVNELQALPYFYYARENLRLIRAAISRGFQQENLSPTESIEISRYYGIFSDNLRIFNVVYKKRIVDNEQSQEVSILHSDTFLALIKKIEQTLNKDIQFSSNNGLAWWNEATAVIDEMKFIENGMIEQIKQRALYSADRLQTYLYWYAIMAAILLSIVGLLTAFTVLRILKALSIVINSLDKVERTKDFGLRIKSKSEDECGQLTLSINKLLSYTDKIIQEKDNLASTDLLTGAMNRRSFIEKAEAEIKRSERHKIPLSLIFCDIDFFKTINDQYGHAIGDEVLKRIILIFKLNLRSHDFIARWGGEEFVILSPETSLVRAQELSEKLRQTIMSVSFPSAKHITTSFGVAQKTPGEKFSELCERADKALYQAKESGRNKVCII